MRNKKLYAYIVENVEEYDSLAPIAKNVCEQTGRPLFDICYSLYNRIVDAMEEWCGENDMDCDEYIENIAEYI